MVWKYYQTEEFLPQLNTLQKYIKKSVLESINDFAMKNELNIEKMNCKKINSDYDLYRLKANKSFRIILHKNKKTKSYVFLWVDDHDEAYDWAKKCNYVFDEDYLTEFKLKCNKEKTKETQKIIKTDFDYPTYNFPSNIPPRENSSLFEHLNSDTLRDFGIPEELIDYVRSVKTYLGFGKLKKVISKASYLLLRNYLISCNKA